MTDDGGELRDGSSQSDLADGGFTIVFSGLLKATRIFVGRFLGAELQQGFCFAKWEFQNRNTILNDGKTHLPFGGQIFSVSNDKCEKSSPWSTL